MDKITDGGENQAAATSFAGQFTWQMVIDLVAVSVGVMATSFALDLFNTEVV
jgi:hypothetical protein